MSGDADALRAALKELVEAVRDVQSQQRDPKQKKRLVARIDAAMRTASALVSELDR